MSKNKLINVVIPVYNSENYLEQCLNSLCKQTYENWHAVIVDDGSADGSAEVCRKFCDKYSDKIDLYLKENGGPGNTRNFAIKKSRADADYWFFLDSDDYIDEDAFEELVNAAEKYQSDITVCGYIRHHGNRSKAISYSKTGLIDKRDVLVSLLQGDEIGSFSCNKLFSNRIIENIVYPEKCFYEDVALFYKVVLASNRICAIDKPLYHYVWHNDSVVTSKKVKQLADLKKAVEDRDSEIEKNYPELSDIIAVNRLKISIHIWNRICKCFGPDAAQKAKTEVDFILSNSKYFKLLDMKNRIMANATKFSPRLYASLMYLLKGFFFLN